MEKIDAVIVTYNRKELLKECLAAVQGQSYPIDRIIVIDNHSDDGTEDLFRRTNECTDARIDYRRLPENIGGAGGFHEGFKYASALNPDWIWIMDDDTIPNRDCLEMLVRDSEKLRSSRISFLASSVFGPDEEAMNVPVLSASVSKSGYPDWYFELDNGMVKIDSATFVSLLISNKAIKAVGLPVKDYFLWWDDTEYTLRLTRYYGPAYLSGRSRTVHKRKQTRKLSIKDEDNRNRIFLYYYLVRNTLITRTEYMGKAVGALDVIKWAGFSVVLLLNFKVKYRCKKAATILKALAAFLLRRYDYRSFANRLPGKKNV